LLAALPDFAAAVRQPAREHLSFTVENRRFYFGDDEHVQLFESLIFLAVNRFRNDVQRVLATNNHFQEDVAGNDALCCEEYVTVLPHDPTIDEQEHAWPTALSFDIAGRR
jgi:hypothetical protein